MTVNTTLCKGCGGSFADIFTAVYPSLSASVGCKATLLHVQSEELALYGYIQPAHHLITSAYFAQHPEAKTSVRGRQELVYHLCGLYCMLVLDFPSHLTSSILRRTITTSRSYRELLPRPYQGDIHIGDVLADTSISRDEYTDRAFSYARSVWDTWEHEHPYIRSLVLNA